MRSTFPVGIFQFAHPYVYARWSPTFHAAFGADIDNDGSIRAASATSPLTVSPPWAGLERFGFQLYGISTTALVGGLPRIGSRRSCSTSCRPAPPAFHALPPRPRRPVPARRRFALGAGTRQKSGRAGIDHAAVICTTAVELDLLTPPMQPRPCDASDPAGRPRWSSYRRAAN